jgi:hypothetical protein
VLTYVPNPEDRIDGYFATIYKNHEGGKFPAKFLRVNPHDEVQNMYEYCGNTIICEAYDGA